MDDLELRAAIYESFALTGARPSRRELQARHPDCDVDAALTRLHAAHALVLDDEGEVRMALPFSGVRTDHVVRAGDRSWYANCAWDALAIPLLLEVDASIEATWLDTGAAVDLHLTDGRLSPTDGFVHFTLPARHWWDDIVET